MKVTTLYHRINVINKIYNISNNADVGTAFAAATTANLLLKHNKLEYQYMTKVVKSSGVQRKIKR